MEGNRSFRRGTCAFQEACVHDARDARKLSGDTDPIHLSPQSDAERRQAAHHDQIWLQLLDLGELSREVLLIRADRKNRDDLAAGQFEIFAEIFVLSLAVVGGVVNDNVFQETLLGEELRCELAFIDHRPVDAMNFVVVVAIGDLGQDGAPHHDRQSEPGIGINRRDAYGRAIVGHTGDDATIRCGLGCDLDADIRLAFVVQGDELENVLCRWVGVSQLHGQLRGIAAPDTGS